MGIKDKLAAAAAPKPFQFEVESWGGETVNLLPFDSAGIDEHDELFEDGDLDANSIYISTVIGRLVDEDGDPVFDQEDDYELFMGFDLAGFYECYRALTERVLGKLRMKTEGTKKNLKSARRKRRRRS